jgi:hypothetical protein
MTDPKVKRPNRITVSGGPKAEPRLYQAHPDGYRAERSFPTWYEVVAAAAIIFLLIVIILTYGGGVR